MRALFIKPKLFNSPFDFSLLRGLCGCKSPLAPLFTRKGYAEGAPLLRSDPYAGKVGNSILFACDSSSFICLRLSNACGGCAAIIPHFEKGGLGGI